MPGPLRRTSPAAPCPRPFVVFLRGTALASDAAENPAAAASAPPATPPAAQAPRPCLSPRAAQARACNQSTRRGTLHPDACIVDSATPKALSPAAPAGERRFHPPPCCSTRRASTNAPDRLHERICVFG